MCGAELLIGGGAIRSVHARRRAATFTLEDPQLTRGARPGAGRPRAGARPGQEAGHDQLPRPGRAAGADRVRRRDAGLEDELPADPRRPEGRRAPKAEEAGALGGKLQGWAIVENQTDSDWTDVQLSLVSGRPISFIQDLYQPLYVPRPVVQPELYASLRPQTYEGGMTARGAGGGAGGSRRGGQRPTGAQAGDRRRRRTAGPRRRRPAAAAAAAAGAVRRPTAARARPSPMDAAASVASIASAAKVGELFQYTVGNVRLPRQKIAMIPIVTDAVEVERLSIYNQNVLAEEPAERRPREEHDRQAPAPGPGHRARRRQPTPATPGSTTCRPGQERLLSYGIDLQVLVDATKNQPGRVHDPDRQDRQGRARADQPRRVHAGLRSPRTRRPRQDDRLRGPAAATATGS